MDRILTSGDEHQWLTSVDPRAMCKLLGVLVNQMGYRISERKMRLFLTACIRQVWHAFRDERTLKLIDAVEQLADGLILQSELDLVWVEAGRPPNRDAGDPDLECPPDTRRARYAAQALGFAANSTISTFEAQAALACLQEASDNPQQAASIQARLLRDVFGNPFHPPAEVVQMALHVVDLARIAYKQPSMPVGTLRSTQLAALWSALAEAGCADARIASHCRETGPHVRGCWAVDLVLGKN